MKKYMQVSFIIGLLIVLGLPSAAVMQDTDAMPLAARGSYHVGERTLVFVDERRDDRRIQVNLWYPAIVPESDMDKLPIHEKAHLPLLDLAPDMSGAPYPLVLYSHCHPGLGSEFGMILEPLVSQGYVVANLTHQDSYSGLTFIDRPLDVLFVINQLAAFNEEVDNELAGIMNTDQIGVIGFDLGAYAALALNGARVDPESVSAIWDEMGSRITSYWSDWDWAEMTAYHNQFVPPVEGDSLWPALTDPRIRASISYAPCDVYHFGERGLAVANVPTMLIGLTEDMDCPYEENAIPAYEQLVSTEHYLLSLVGAYHEVPDTLEKEQVVRQYVTAFFGYHLQGKTEYAKYLTEEYAESLDNVVWGPYESE